MNQGAPIFGATPPKMESNIGRALISREMTDLIRPSLAHQMVLKLGFSSYPNDTDTYALLYYAISPDKQH